MLENSLRKTIERDELRLLYQPQLDLVNDTLVGVEALLRWQHPDFGLIDPGRFIELAEQTGLMIDIGEWVLKTACQQARQWQEAGLDICVAVNVGHQQIQRGVIQEQVENALHGARLPASHLKLEVLENFVMENAGASVVVLQALRDRGVNLAIDDFGTGYSSLAYLHQLPIQQLKIDQSFVRDMPHDRGSQAIIRAIVALGDNLGLEVLAEGIETAEQRAFLVAEGCHLGQGYLLARPMPGPAIAEWLEQRTASIAPDEA
ncbi:putative bifunctional diguanylate cyclase/phosphodiesterase [endosymbiont of unidentified scaly snail isolate Monju]|uniref:putative bifunctional diguanylate cyclase/phosphodiesterase n=1 Tax=endosymbiont of unidentified scaly snail isolate Monju TaxID=1248727 RepID=UPI0022B23DB9|nr:EAL domain-containing protein [endosymbiont of unidentified scaly snail isolate Monju]